MEFCILASSSKGNSLLIRDGASIILVDMGLSFRQFKSNLINIGIRTEQISALLISHEHHDHIQGVPFLLRETRMPWYITQDSYDQLSPIYENLCHPNWLNIDNSLMIGSIQIKAFDLPHDAAKTLGFVFQNEAGRKLGIATDLGFVTDQIETHLEGCHVLIIEANHDEKMLIEGNYTWQLKQRILGAQGHLSNRAARELLTKLNRYPLHSVVLAHLSENNNLPEKAFSTISPVLNGIKVVIAPPNMPTDWITV